MDGIETINAKELQGFSFPFHKDKVRAIHIHCYPKSDSGWRSTIEFKNGTTKGEQEFGAKELPDLLYQMKNFVDNL